MQRLIFIAAVAALLLTLPALGRTGSREPVLTLVFTANTIGTFRPCPTWGGRTIGGLARRATAFDRMRQSPAGTRTMFVAGPGEILPAEGGEQAPDSKELPALAKAYSMLGYNFGYLDAREGKALAQAGAQLPPGFLVAGNEPRSAVYTVAGDKIGVVFFPEIAANTNPGDPVVRAIEREVETLRPQVKLVVGVSPWGSDAEGKYLDRLDRSKPAVDILLGGGPGIGLTPRPAAGGKVLWMRSFSKGKTVDSVDLLAWPTGPGYTWTEKTDFLFQVTSLGEEFPGKPEIEALFGPADGKPQDVKSP